MNTSNRRMAMEKKMIVLLYLLCCVTLIFLMLRVKTNYNAPTDVYDLRLIAIVYNREKSLHRLLVSLNEADYGIDKVKLEVWIDRSKTGEIDQATLHAAHNFSFRHGDYSVEVHPTHVGILGQWISTWKPKNENSEIAVILEDDLTVSRYFYTYLKLVHKTYDDNPKINGYTLQGLSHKHHVNDQSTLKGPKDDLVFLYPVVGSWGFSPNNFKWINFVKWCNTASHNESILPYVPDNIATTWFKTFKAENKSDTMWSIWHIYYSWIHGEFTLYPNFKDHIGLSTNWREKGLHYIGADAGPTNTLLSEWKSEYNHLPKSPVCLDIKGKIIPH